MKKGKKYVKAAELVEKGKLYTIDEAAKLVKETSTTKFDATVDMSFHLNIDPKQADQQLRGTINLPHGNGKVVRVLAITHKVDEAKDAGADFVGGKEMLEKIQKENWFDYDVIVATPDMMGELGRLGRILGPKGLMPNPKTGTVTQDIAKAVSEIKAGKVQYRNDRDGNMHVSVGRVSFEETKLSDNMRAVVDHILRIRPSAVKGTYVLTCVVHTTMGPSIPLLVSAK